MSKSKFQYEINRYSEKVFKNDGTPIKLSDPFLAAREVSREGGVDNFLDKHYKDRRYHEWKQEDPHNDLTLDEIGNFEEIARIEKSGKPYKIFDC